MIEAYGSPQIDLLSLDVEGFELQVLKGLDLERHGPTWMLIEARYRDEIDSFLGTVYEVVDELSYHDVLYRRRVERNLVRSLSRVLWDSDFRPNHF